MRAGQWLSCQCRRVLMLVSLCGMLAGVGTGQAAVVITTLPEAVVSGPSIRLSDVAQIEGDEVDLVARLQMAVLGQVPPPDIERHLSRSTMLRQLKLQGFAVQTLQWQGAQQVRVRCATQRLTVQQLEAAVRHALGQRLQRLAPSLTLRDIRGLQAVSVTPGAVQYDVLTSARPPRAGPLPFTLAIRVAGKTAQQITGTASLTLPQEAEVKNAGPAAAGGGRPAAPAGNLENRNASVRQQGLASRAMDTRPLVKRGDLVQIVSEASLIKVSTPGEALESGRVGDTIRVKNTTSNREVRGQIIDKQTVRVSL